MIREISQTRLAFSSLSPLFVDRFGRSLQFCYAEFDMVSWHIAVFEEGEGVNFK